MSTVIDLASISTKPPQGTNKKKIKKETKKLVKELQDLQFKLFAQGEKALLIVMQGIDASGKGSTIRRVFSRLHPAGVNVSPFRYPTPEEWDHPYLWRAMREVPAKGTIGIFDRSHYEDVLVPKVLKTVDKATLEARYDEINQREQMLQANDVHILKFFFHVGKKKQRDKLLRRLVRPERYRKHNSGDWKTREYREEYQDAYEQMIQRCTSPERIIVPTNKGWYKRYIIAKKTVEMLRSMDIDWPDLELDEATKPLLEEAKQRKNELL